MSIGHLYFLFGEVSVWALCPFLIGMFFDLYELLAYFGHLAPFQRYHLQASSLFCFVDGFPCGQAFCLM